MELHTHTTEGGLRIGRHSVDGDTLVFDPALSSPGSTNVALFSLTEFRTRAFPPAFVASRIEEITDPEQREQAEKRYHSWPALKAERDLEMERLGAEGVLRRREQILEEHRLFVESRGVAYQGVKDTVPGAKRRRSACSRCGIPLDDFVGASCVGCGSVLCSCGACGCGRATAGGAS